MVGNTHFALRVVKDMDPPADPERERFALAALRSLDEMRAPQGLRERIEAERARSARGRPRRLALAGALAGAAAAVVLTLALVLPGGAGGPTVVEAAGLGTRPADSPAPAAAEPGLLDVSSGGVTFPDWEDGFGWRAVGRRVDELDGHRAVTVFYEKGGRRLAYTIVAGEALAWPDEWKQTRWAGHRYDHARQDGRLVVTWRRRGRTCVVSGGGLELERVLELAGAESFSYWPMGRS